ncbi:MAG: allantoinase AllB [Acidobacteriota bacterium]|nr:allantoinase AllB [Acidobacteriota bacterium]
MREQIVRGGTLVTPDGLLRADLRIEGETIQAIEPEIRGGGRVVDATGLHVFPATIDVHVHFNEPGRAEWEGSATGSRALAAGGGAVFFDMPLNSTPCTVNAREFDRKRAALEASSIADFGIWGGLIPGNLAEMAELADRGAVGFKAFLCDSGLPEFPRADDLTLWEGLAEAARLDLPVAVHAESQELTQELSRRRTAKGISPVADFLASRPVLAELEAIQRATLMAGETKARLHIVHVSSGRAAAAAAEARARGVDVSIETCPHYLFFTSEDLERLGALAKCAPPPRNREHQNELWAELVKGAIDIVASDHSPAPPEMKTGDFEGAWGGVAGVQSTLNVLLDRGHFNRGIPLEHIAGLLAATPARRFRIPRRGSIRPGNHADLTLVDLAGSFTLQPEEMAHRHRLSPYAGEKFRGVVRRTIRRGETIFADGSFPSITRGQLVRPER